MSDVLDVRDIHTYYGGSYVLQGVSLRVGSGQVVALLGRNGVGKTTTIRSIIGFTPPREGTIVFKDTEITTLPAYRIARMGICLVPQGRRIFESLTVSEHLSVFKARRVEENGWDLERVLSLFPALTYRLKQRGSTLSGGEQQMLAIGRALLRNPQLLLMDEPTEGLSPLLVQQVADVIEHLKETSGLPMLLVEQNFPLALRLADYIYVMNKGAIVFEGTAQELSESVEIQHTYLGM